MKPAAEKMMERAARIERTADNINWVAGKVWRVTAAMFVLAFAIDDFRSALTHSPFLFSDNGTWFFFATGTIETVIAMDIFVRGPRAWILVSVE